MSTALVHLLSIPAGHHGGTGSETGEAAVDRIARTATAARVPVAMETLAVPTVSH